MLPHDHNDPEHKRQVEEKLHELERDNKAQRAFGALGIMSSMAGLGVKDATAIVDYAVGLAAHGQIDDKTIDTLEDIFLLIVDRYPEKISPHLMDKMMMGIEAAKVTVEKEYDQENMTSEPEIIEAEFEVVDDTDEEENDATPSF